MSGMETSSSKLASRNPFPEAMHRMCSDVESASDESVALSVNVPVLNNLTSNYVQCESVCCSSSRWE